MRIPVATYRLQFGPSFGFKDAREIVSYLSGLGIGDIYASPILKATAGSTHGYDMTDPTEINPQLGASEDFQALTAERQAHAIGWLQDIVPNHMAYSHENALLMDVFESGPRSDYFDWFDVFRDHPARELRTRVLAPVLGSPLEDVLRQGQVRLDLDRDGLALRYYDWRFPLALACYDEVLGHATNEPGPQELADVCSGWTELDALPPGSEKRTRIAQAKRELVRRRDENQGVAAHLQRVLDVYNRRDDSSALAGLIERQWYKLIFWRMAGQCINYRRFFYLNDFISLRVEKPAVFERVHERMIELARAGVVTGLRVDHVDGLHDPLAYLRRLRERLPDAYLVVEKILDLEETLPTRWPIDGTSGYKFCNYVNGLFCDCGSEPAFTNLYHEIIGAPVDYDTQLYDAKLRVLKQHMGGEVAYLAGLIAGALDAGEQASGESWREAVAAVIAAFPVYRTYADAEQFSDRDRAFVTAAVLAAKQQAPHCEVEIDRIGQLLLSHRPHGTGSDERNTHRYLVMRFQQFTGPAMAKGLEDTLFYTYNRFISLNEVGGDPASFGVPLERFHRFNEMRARHWPGAMNATSTHDAKRGEDVRARLNVLSEMPKRWREKVRHWAELNAGYKHRHEGSPAPDANDEYFLYQTLVGALPFYESQWEGFRNRLKDCTIKALREAKRHTTWTEPNEAYENGCLAFVDHLMDRDPQNAFWSDFLPFQREVAAYGVYNSLSQTTLKITCPGLPDFYQGADLWDLALVDPDNRRPVDFTVRKQTLEAFEASADTARSRASQLLASKEDGRVKLYLIHTLLRLRSAQRALFAEGDYLPLEVSGPWARHVVAFLRAHKDAHVLVVVPRFVSALVGPDEMPAGGQVWRDTYISLPEGTSGVWQNVLADDTLQIEGDLKVSDALPEFPVGVFLKEPPAA